MIVLVESKTKWNLGVFVSAAEAFDEEAKDYRGAKGVAVTAALLLWLNTPKAERQRYIDIVKIAEGRGMDGTVLDAAKGLIRKSDAAEGSLGKTAVDRARSQLRPPQRKRSGS